MYAIFRNNHIRFYCSVLFILLFFVQSFSISTNTFQGVDPCGCEDQPHLELIAIVNGRKFYKQDLGAETKSRVIQAQNAVVEARRSELDREINNHLLETEAKKRGLTVPQLLQIEVSVRVTEPTDAEAKAFYSERKEKLGISYNEAKPHIITYLKSEREKDLTLKLLARLRSAASIKILNADVTPPDNEPDKNRVFAIVNDQKVTSREIESSLGPLIFQVQQQVYNIRKEDLDLRINDMLLAEESKRKGIAANTLVEDYVKARTPIITDAQAQDYYNKNKKAIGGKFEHVKYQIIQYLMGEEERKLIVAYAEELRRAASVQIFLMPPQPQAP